MAPKKTSRSKSKGKPAARAKKATPKGASVSTKGPNLLVTIDEQYRQLAQQDAAKVLDRVAGLKYAFTQPPATGLLGIRVEGMDPRACIGKLREMALENPFQFQHSHRWMPIEAWRKAEMSELAKFAELANTEIEPTESWRIQLERHGNQLDRDLMINTVARDIKNENVDLEAADKTVLVEVVGDQAGIAIVKADQILSIDQMLAHDFVEFTEVRGEA